MKRVVRSRLNTFCRVSNTHYRAASSATMADPSRTSSVRSAYAEPRGSNADPRASGSVMNARGVSGLLTQPLASAKDAPSGDQWFGLGQAAQHHAWARLPAFSVCVEEGNLEAVKQALERELDRGRELRDVINARSGVVRDRRLQRTCVHAADVCACTIIMNRRHHVRLRAEEEAPLPLTADAPRAVHGRTADELDGPARGE